MPTAKMLGTELRDFVKNKLDTWSNERKTINIEAHLRRNKARLERAASDPPSIQQLSLVPLWFDGIENIDSSDAMLSEAWDSVLNRILDGDPWSEILLQKLKSLSAIEARTLLRFRDPAYFVPVRGRADEIHLLLVDKGLLHKEGFDISRFLNVIAPAFGLIFLVAALKLLAFAVGGIGFIDNFWKFAFTTLNQDTVRRFPIFGDVPFGVLTIGCLIGMSIMMQFYKPRSYSLTNLGERLLDKARSAKLS